MDFAEFVANVRKNAKKHLKFWKPEIFFIVQFIMSFASLAGPRRARTWAGTPASARGPPEDSSSCSGPRRTLAWV